MKIYLTFSSLAVELVLLLSHSCWKSSLIHRGISLKGLKMHLNIDQRKLPVFFGMIIQKNLQDPLMFSGFSRRFLHSFRSLHSLRVATSSATATPKGTPAFATDSASLRSLRSLHSFRKVSSKPEKSVILIRIFWTIITKKCQRPLIYCEMYF